MKSLLIIILCLPSIISAQVENNIPKDNFIIEFNLGSSNPSGIHLNYEKWLTPKDAIRAGIFGNIGYSSRNFYGGNRWSHTLGANIGYRRVIFKQNRVQLLTGLDVGFLKSRSPYSHFSYDCSLSATIPLELRIKLNDKISFTSSLGVRVSENIRKHDLGLGLVRKMGLVIKL